MNIAYFKHTYPSNHECEFMIVRVVDGLEDSSVGKVPSKKT